MIVTAKQCVPVSSRWVRLFILTCDLKLAVQFKDEAHPLHPRVRHPKPDVCCYYPNTNQNLFDLAIVSDPGRFVWKYLYRKEPYIRIPPPCPAVSCAACACNPPNTVHMTIKDRGGCACLGGTYALVLGADSLNPTDWYYTGTVCGTTLVLRMNCNQGGNYWYASVACRQGATTSQPNYFACAPGWIAAWKGLPVQNLCCNGTIDITITP
jgi:hypothetical protein